jgi:small-conductance mechanosensitive channel
MNAPVTSIDQIKSTLIDLAIRFGPKMLVAILILFVGFMVSRWVSQWLARALSRIELEPPVRALLARIGWIVTFTTTLLHPDRSRVVIPNRKIVGEILHNFGTVRQLDIVVGVAYDTDINAAVAAVSEVLQTNARVLRDPAPIVQTLLLGDSSVSIGIRPWVSVTDYRAASGEINKAVLETFRSRGIVLPFPQREVRLIECAQSTSKTL